MVRGEMDSHTGRTTSTKIWSSSFSRQPFWNSSAKTFGYVQSILSYVFIIMISISSHRVKLWNIKGEKSAATVNKQTNKQFSRININIEIYYGGRVVEYGAAALDWYQSKNYGSFHHDSASVVNYIKMNYELCFSPLLWNEIMQIESKNRRPHFTR